MGLDYLWSPESARLSRWFHNIATAIITFWRTWLQNSFIILNHWWWSIHLSRLSRLSVGLAIWFNIRHRCMLFRVTAQSLNMLYLLKLVFHLSSWLWPSNIHIHSSWDVTLIHSSKVHILSYRSLVVKILHFLWVLIWILLNQKN